eukprot:3922932-Pleurochrysis_carterae.AAC.1
MISCDDASQPHAACTPDQSTCSRAFARSLIFAPLPTLWALALLPALHTSGRYTERAYFFDVHPPLSKLLMLATALAFGYEGRATCPYEKPEPFAANCDLVAQRLLPAICGALLVPLVYATCAACKMHP